MTVPEHLFVYGILRRGFSNDHARMLRASCEFLGEASFHGKLFDVGSYPAAVASPEPGDIVRGEIYRMMRPRQLLPMLDRFEGCGADDAEPHLYRRESMEVRLDSGRKLSAWVYLYNRETDRLRPIHHGDYAAYRASGGKMARG